MSNRAAAGQAQRSRGLRSAPGFRKRPYDRSSAARRATRPARRGWRRTDAETGRGTRVPDPSEVLLPIVTAPSRSRGRSGELLPIRLRRTLVRSAQCWSGRSGAGRPPRGAARVRVPARDPVRARPGGAGRRDPAKSLSRKSPSPAPRAFVLLTLVLSDRSAGHRADEGEQWAGTRAARPAPPPCGASPWSAGPAPRTVRAATPVLPGGSAAAERACSRASPCSPAPCSAPPPSRPRRCPRRPCSPNPRRHRTPPAATRPGRPLPAPRPLPGPCPARPRRPGRAGSPCRSPAGSGRYRLRRGPDRRRRLTGKCVLAYNGARGRRARPVPGPR
jgi:hypothetical protein